MSNQDFYKEQISKGVPVVSKEVPKESHDEEIVVIEKDKSKFGLLYGVPSYKAIYKGKTVLTEICQVGQFHDGRAKITFIGAPHRPIPKFGFINTRGELVIPCDYVWVSDFRNNVAIGVRKRQQGLGLIDLEGRHMLPFNNESIGSANFERIMDYDIYKDNTFSKMFIPFCAFGKENIFNVMSGKPMDFRNGYGLIKEGDFFGLYKVDLTEVLPCKYKWAVRINEEEFLLREGSNLIYYNAETGDYIE